MAILNAPIIQQELRPGMDTALAVREGTKIQISSPPTVVSLEHALPELLVPGEIRLATLSDPRLRVTAPIRVRLFEEHGQVVAEATELSEFGFGSNISEAMDDIQRAIAQLYFSLDESSERLGPDLKTAWSGLQRAVVRTKIPE